MSRFTRLDEIQILVEGFRIDEVELVTRTVENRAHEMSEWLIVGEKV